MLFLDFYPYWAMQKIYTLHASIIQMIGRLGQQDTYHEELRRLAFSAHMKESQYLVP